VSCTLAVVLCGVGAILWLECMCIDRLYLVFTTGRAGHKFTGIDARELYLLVELYPLLGLKKWLLTEGVHASSYGAAFAFSQHHEGGDPKGPISVACAQFAMQGGLALEERLQLHGVGPDTISQIIADRLAQPCGRMAWTR
jgi:hypothetical protein